MKKTFFVGGIIFLIASAGLKSLEIPAKAEILAKQVVNNAPKISAGSPQVELLTAGAEPRQELRFKPVVGSKETASMTMNMNLAMSVEGKAVPAFKMPATVMTTDAIVTKVDPNGDIHYEFSYTDADIVGDTTLPPELINKMRAEINKMKGFKGSAIVDSRGQTKKASFILPQNLEPSLKQMLEQMSKSMEQLSSPVPQQAVGIGAKWRVSSAVNVSGISLNQIVTYELVDIKDGVATLNITLEQQAPPSQKLTSPQSPKGITLSIKSYNGTGQGRALVALNKLLPINSTVSVRSNSEMVGKTSSGEETTINQQITMEMSIQTK